MARIGSKITGFFIMIALFSSVLVGVLTLWRSQRIVEKVTLQKMLFQTKYLSEVFEKDLQKLRSTSSGIESILHSSFPQEGLTSQNIPGFTNDLRSRILKLGENLKSLSVWLAFNPEVIKGQSSIGYFDKECDGIYRPSPTYNIEQMDLSSPSMTWWTEAVKHGEVWTEPYYWENWDMELISYSKAIYIDSVFIGCLGSDFYFTELRQQWGNVRLYDTGFLVLLNEELNFLIHPDHQGENVKDVLDSSVYVRFMEQLNVAPSGFIYYWFQEQDKVLAFHKLSNGWILMAVVPLKEIFRPIAQIANTLFVILLIVILLSVLIAIFLSKTITAPLQDLVSLFNRAEKGDLFIRSTIKTKDELQNLGERFNRFMQQMQNMIRRLRDQEKALIYEKERAEESDRLKTAFLGNLSHEIRTPLYAIVGYSQLLEDPEISHTEKNQFIHVIKKNNDKLLKFIEDILIFSQLEQGLISCQMKEIDLPQFLSELFKEFQATYQSHQKIVKLELDFASNPNNTMVRTDPHLLKKGVVILMENAYKFTKEGRIILGGFLNEKTWGIYVRDSGIGIPAGYQKLIFNKFYKYSADSSVLYEGVGMGLSIAMGLIQLLRGEISVKSEKGRGSTFSVEFSLK